MRALYHRRVYGASWDDMNRRILSNRSEMDLRLAAFEYIKQNYANWRPIVTVLRPPDRWIAYRPQNGSAYH